MVTIHQGDDTNAFGNKIVVKFNTEADMTGMQAVFQLGSFRQEFTDISTKEIEIVIPGNVTAEFSPGYMFGAIQIVDTAGRKMTLENKIPFWIAPKVVL